MSMVKMNVMHWHITDYQSFPLHLASRPLLAKQGSYGRQHTYNSTDIARLVEFARLRGIRVVPEIDVGCLCVAL